MGKSFGSMHCCEESVRGRGRELRYDIEIASKIIGHRINSENEYAKMKWNSAD
jgi:hypothetical protein